VVVLLDTTVLVARPIHQRMLGPGPGLSPTMLALL